MKNNNIKEINFEKKTQNFYVYYSINNNNIIDNINIKHNFKIFAKLNLILTLTNISNISDKTIFTILDELILKIYNRKI